ncbi:hypothetical protein JW926_00175 [Candidatus Sumerlaeota bacterium]|nr:hypothetical protein [Candidatus Sumerlaeota bacterium]
MMKRKFMSVLCLCLAILMVSFGVAQESAPEKIADKMAPKDATGDLEKVQEETPSGEQAQVTPTETMTEAQILTMPKDKQIQTESQEPENPPNILEDPQVRNLLNPKPVFIYNPRDLKDPMIVPWVRHTLLVKEFLITLEKRLGEARTDPRKIQEAKSIIRQIEELLPDVSDLELKKKSEDKLSKLQEILLQLESEPKAIVPVDTPIAPPTEIQIPTWIKANFAGVIWHPNVEERIALIGDEILKEGQKVPKYPDAVVQKINPTSVVISYRGKTEEITVEKQE